VAGQVIASELLAAAQANEDILERIVREHARLVYRVAYSVVRNHHDAEDVTQETFVRLLRSRNKLNGVRDAKTWLARIAWRAAIDRTRKRPSVTLEEVDDGALRVASAATDQLVLAAEMGRLLRRMIAGLPRQLREVIVLSTVQELSPAEIGKVMGIGEAAVRSRLFRARQILKDKMASLLEGKHER
jgi:RNA polymerase sigma-70 factor (ECF subfamily)